MNFRVDLETYRGPLDLLLYLVRKHEVDVLDIPIALITRQYLEYLEILESLDVDSVGDFLEMASTLVEIKSRLALPNTCEEEETLEDPRNQLVEQLLEYKKYKDAASMLEDAAVNGRNVTCGWPTTCHRAESIAATSRSTKSRCGISLVPLVGSCGTVERHNRPTSSTMTRQFTSIWAGSTLASRPMDAFHFLRCLHQAYTSRL